MFCIESRRFKDEFNRMGDLIALEGRIAKLKN